MYQNLVLIQQIVKYLQKMELIKVGGIFFDKKTSQMTSKLEYTVVKRFNAYQHKFGRGWLSANPCRSYIGNLSNQRLRIAFRLRLGLKVFEKRVCEKIVTHDG